MRPYVKRFGACERVPSTLTSALADEMLNLADERLETALANRTIIEVICDE